MMVGVEQKKTATTKPEKRRTLYSTSASSPSTSQSTQLSNASTRSCRVSSAAAWKAASSRWWLAVSSSAPVEEVGEAGEVGEEEKPRSLLAPNDFSVASFAISFRLAK